MTKSSKIKKILKHTNHTKSIQKGVIGHDMATTQPTNPQIDHPEKRKIYPSYKLILSKALNVEEITLLPTAMCYRRFLGLQRNSAKSAI